MEPIAEATVPAAPLLIPEMERSPVTVEIRSAGGSDNKVEGYAQLYGGRVNDRQETFEPGSGAKTIAERVAKRRVKITDDHQWTAEHTHGVVTRAAEDSTGLQFFADWSAADNSQQIKTKLAEGIVDEWSIEFIALQESYQRAGDILVRSIGEFWWRGLSCTTYSSQGEGTTLNVRSALAPGLTPYQALPLAPLATPWDAAAAQARVLAWASNVNEPARAPHLRRAFLCEQRGAGVAGYSMLIADIVADKLVAVPAAIAAAGRALLVSSQGEDPVRQVQLRNHLDRYYQRIQAELKAPGLVAPWTYAAVDGLIAQVRSAAAISAPAPADAIQELANLAKTIIAALPEPARGELGVPKQAGPEQAAATTVAAPPPTSEVDSTDAARRRKAEEEELDLELQLLM